MATYTLNDRGDAIVDGLPENWEEVPNGTVPPWEDIPVSGDFSASYSEDYS